MPPENLLPWIALNLLPGLGPVLARRALERFGGPGEVAFRVPARALESVPGVGPERARAVVQSRPTLASRAESEWRKAEKLGISVLAQDSPDYPAELLQIPDPPVVLYVKGSVVAAQVRVAVVGSRRATYYGKRVATGLASGLAARGIEIVSGGARGIDTCAHLGALEERGRSVAVLGSGLARPYPSENEALFERIAAAGAVVSEFPLATEPRPENFPRRNRLISGLSAAIVVVEATRKSGSLSTAGHALEQGREVLAVPGPVSSDRSEGCHRLIQQGARLVQNVEDIVEELSPMYRSALLPAPPDDGESAMPRGLLPDEQVVLEMLAEPEPVQLDDLAENAPFGLARLQSALLGLELRGVVEALPGRYYGRATGRRGFDGGPIPPGLHR